MQTSRQTFSVQALRIARLRMDDRNTLSTLTSPLVDVFGPRVLKPARTYLARNCSNARRCAQYPWSASNYDHKPLIVKVDCKIVYEFCFAVLGAIDAGVSAQLPQGKGARTDIGDAREASGQVGLRRGHLVCPLANNALSAVSVWRRTRTMFGSRAAIGFVGL